MHPSEVSDEQAQALSHIDAYGARRTSLVPVGSTEEAEALERIDELREEDEEGLMRGHPDVGLGFRRGAPRSSLDARRRSAVRYWRKFAGTR